MGIKRLKKVFVITGAENSGKTRCVKEIARKFYESHYEYHDLMQTTYADFLNREPKKDMNDDIVGYFTTPFDTIGILSAGDEENLILKMFDLLRNFQPDVIIIAIRDEFIQDAVSKMSDITIFDSTENNNLLKPAEDFLEKKDTESLLNITAINKFVEEIKSAIRGF